MKKARVAVVIEAKKVEELVWSTRGKVLKTVKNT